MATSTKSVKKTNKSSSGSLPKKLPSLFSKQLGKPALFIIIFGLIGIGTLLYSLAAVPTGQIKLKANGKCLENFYNRQIDGNFISTYPCSSTNKAQQWSVYSTDKSIRTAQNYCLDVQKGGTAPLTKVHLWHCTGGAPQKWDVLSSGQLRNPNSMLCLEAGATNTFLGGPNMYVNTCNSSNARQIWTVPTSTPIAIAPLTPAPTNPPATSTTTSTGIPGPGNTGPRTSVPVRGAMTITTCITLRDFHISGGTYGINVKIPDSAGCKAVIEYGIIENMSSAGIYGSNFEVRNVEIREGQNDGIKPIKNVVIESNWIHHLGKADGSHADAAQLQQASNVRARGNFCDIGYPAPSGYRSNACFMIQDNSNNVIIENNWLNGGNYTINCKAGTGVSNITIRNNWWGEHQYGRISGPCSETGGMTM